MFSRRDFLQLGMATSAIYGASGFGSFSKLSAQQKLSQDDLLRFDTYGNVSLIHITDIHAQLKPIYFREPRLTLVMEVLWDRSRILLGLILERCTE